MSGPGIIGLFLGLFLLAGLIAWSSWKSNSRRLARIRADWGRPRNRRRDLEAIADLFECHDAASESIDDRTWHDLLLDDVFAALDRTESSVGQQMLYRRLRSAPAPRALSAFEALVTRAASGSRIREHAQLALARLSDSSASIVRRDQTRSIPDRGMSSFRFGPPSFCWDWHSCSSGRRCSYSCWPHL